MKKLGIVLQVVLGLAMLAAAITILAGTADDIRDHLGLAAWFWVLAGLVELVGALALLAGLKYAKLAAPAGLWVTVTMASALISHLRVGDPLADMVPATLLLALALVVTLLRAVSIRRSGGPERRRLRSSSGHEASMIARL